MGRNAVERAIKTVERAIKTEIETETEQNGVGKLGWFMSLTTTKT